MKISIYLFLSILLWTCQSDLQDCEDSNFFLSEFSKGVSEPFPPANSDLLMFFKLDDGSILKINNVGLFDLYKKGYIEEYTFDSFLCALFNNKLYLEKKILKPKLDRYQIIQPNKRVESLNIKMVGNQYLIKTGDQFYLKNDPDESTRITVLYMLFNEKKHITFDDYSGFYVITN